MAKKQERYDANLPRNLTYRKRRKSFYWRNPLTGEEFNLGAIARREAISQAIEANHFIESNFSPVALLDRLSSRKAPVMSFNDWLERYEVIFKRRDLAERTIKIRMQQFVYIRDALGATAITDIETRHIAKFLEGYLACGKTSMAVALRSLLSDVFREAIAEGIIKHNPVTATRSPTPKVKRERLTIEEFWEIHANAQSSLPDWASLGMELALLTGQRREDICEMKKSDVRENRLWVIQGKTGAQLAIPLKLHLDAAGLTVGDVIEKCISASEGEYLIGSDSRKAGRTPGALHPDTLTKAFVTARKSSALQFTDTPPTFHEIRSLSGRLYEKEYGKEFAQKLLGHKSMKMTDKYLDSRAKEWSML